MLQTNKGEVCSRFCDEGPKIISSTLLLAVSSENFVVYQDNIKD